MGARFYVVEGISELGIRVALLVSNSYIAFGERQPKFRSNEEEYGREETIVFDSYSEDSRSVF